MNTQKYYSLYYSREKSILKLKLLKPKDLMYDYAQRECSDKDPIYYYSDCYYLSHSRKDLKTLALEIKEDWISELKYFLKILENIKI